MVKFLGYYDDTTIFFNFKKGEHYFIFITRSESFNAISVSPYPTLDSKLSYNYEEFLKDFEF